jgi:hypothetical protein
MIMITQLTLMNLIDAMTLLVIFEAEKFARKYLCTSRGNSVVPPRAAE